MFILPGNRSRRVRAAASGLTAIARTGQSTEAAERSGAGGLVDLGSPAKSSARRSASSALSRTSRNFASYTGASTTGAASATSSPPWRDRSTTSSCAATTVKAGARCSFRAASNIRSHRTRAAHGHQAHVLQCSGRLAMRFAVKSERISSRAIGRPLRRRRDDDARRPSPRSQTRGVRVRLNSSSSLPPMRGSPRRVRRTRSVWRGRR